MWITRILFLFRYGEKQQKGESGDLTGLQLLAATASHLRKPNQQLLIPITIWIGMEQAFIGADFTQVGTEMISTVQSTEIKYLEICTLRLENLLLPLFLVQISVKPTFALSLSLSLSLALFLWPSPWSVRWFRETYWILQRSNASIFSQYQHYCQILNGEDGGQPTSHENEGGASNNTLDFRFDGHSKH